MLQSHQTNVHHKAFDKDQDGYIHSDDVLHVVSLLGYNPAQTVVIKEWRVAGSRPDGKVNFSEFVKKVRTTENEKRNRNDGVASGSSMLKLRNNRNMLKSRM
jgi:hypothetical protein